MLCRRYFLQFFRKSGAFPALPTECIRLPAVEAGGAHLADSGAGTKNVSCRKPECLHRRQDMFFYQAVIMGAVIAAIYILAHFLKNSHRRLLILFIAVLILAGSAGLYSIQYFFGNHFYKQKLPAAALGGIQVSSAQFQTLKQRFSDYSELGAKGKSSDILSKTYHVSGNGASSSIEVDVYLFSNGKDADNNFEASQKFYENKNYIPLDIDQSRKFGGRNRYLISYIRSQYTSYTDFIYLPSRITYSSDVLVQSGDVLFQITEVSNKPVTNKAAVLNDIEKRLQAK